MTKTDVVEYVITRYMEVPHATSSHPALMLLTIGCTTLTTADIEDTVDTAVAAALAEQKAVSSLGETTASGAAPLPGTIASRTFIKLGDIDDGDDQEHALKGRLQTVFSSSSG